ncbi:hypothetical protein ACLKMY_37785 [Paraburkholderia mimosarum]|uniref:hypothetical protein n=1 Tax=Paraburkholderia mimosarum TaxID=312026 RepID=UPI0039C1B7F1
MSATPCIAWLTNGSREQLLQLARSEGETPERLAGDLLVEAMRARHAAPVDYATIEAPVEHKSEWSAGDLEEDEDEPSAETAEVQPKSKFDPRAEKREQAEAFLRDLLADGPRLATEVQAAALAAGFARAAIHAAAERLRVDKRKARGCAHGRSWWSLPD